MDKTKQILIIDDEENMRHMLSSVMVKASYLVSCAADGAQGLDAVSKKKFIAILCDLKMPVMDGLEFLRKLRAKGDETTVIMMSAYATVDTAVEAMKQGAFDFITKPFKNDEILVILSRAEERDQLLVENKKLKKQVATLEGREPFGNLVGNAQVMLDVIETAKKVSDYKTTILITGESGTGKELIAKGIHQQSSRKRKPLICVNCGSIPENLLESEFFGYSKGAFTGADSNKKGLFEAADGGTLFLDEIGELPLSLQVKLLRVLQEEEVWAVGGRRAKKVDVRVVAATALDLAEEVAKGTFRKDLFYRLNVVMIHIPPLRDRKEDIPLLCDFFLEKFCEKAAVPLKSASPKALAVLMNQDWPGNVRQLENVIERAVIFAEKNVILPENLPESFGSPSRGRRLDDLLGTLSIKKGREIMEERLIRRALDITEGNKSQAAKILEVSYPSLLGKIKEYGIKS